MNLKEKLSSVDVFFGAALKHPFCYIAIISVLLMPLGFAQAENVNIGGLLIEAVLWALGLAALVYWGKPSDSKKINNYLYVSSLAMIAIFSLITAQKPSHSTALYIPVLFGLLQFGFVLYRENKLTTERVIVMMMLLGVVLRYCYCLKNNSVSMQHDIGSFTGTNGHLSFINYWYENGLKLPDFDVTTRWQFYHPPLSHMLMALAMRILTVIGLPLGVAQEAIQILPMIWSGLCMAAVYRICKLIGLKDAGLVFAMFFVCFYPTFLIFGGAFNNDMLSAFLMILSMLWTLKWVKNPTMRNIIPIALCIGGGMMTKLSAWMVAPATAFVFIYVLIKNIKKPLTYIAQFLAFGVVCVPLGLWWGVRNLLKFGVPLTYIPDAALPAMSLENVPVLNRLFDFGFYQFAYPYEAFTMYKAPYNEANPFFGLVKTSIFDEYHDAAAGDFAVAMVVIVSVLAVIGVIALIWQLIRKDGGMDFVTKVFLATVFFTIVVFYYIFCFQCPYVCTENIRYCIPIIPILAIATGFGINHFLGKNRKKA